MEVKNKRKKSLGHFLISFKDGFKVSFGPGFFLSFCSIDEVTYLVVSRRDLVFGKYDILDIDTIS